LLFCNLECYRIYCSLQSWVILHFWDFFDFPSKLINIEFVYASPCIEMVYMNCFVYGNGICISYHISILSIVHAVLCCKKHLATQYDAEVCVWHIIEIVQFHSFLISVVLILSCLTILYCVGEFFMFGGSVWINHIESGMPFHAVCLM
jgi:hypothetical protein